MSEEKAVTIREILEKESPAYLVAKLDMNLRFYLDFNAKTEHLRNALHTNLRALVQKLDQEAFNRITLEPLVD